MTYSMQPRTTVHSLQVATNLHHFIESQVLPDTGISAHHFWQGFDADRARPGAQKHGLAG
jgi:malate synthase